MIETNSKQTIVNKYNRLKSLNLDDSTHDLYQASLPLIVELTNDKSSILRYSKLMHVYSDVFDDFISTAEIYANEAPNYLARFLKSIQDKILVHVSPGTFNLYLNFSRKILRYLSTEHGIGSYDKKKCLIDIDIPFDKTDLPRLNNDKSDYYRWWIIKNKSGKGTFIDLTYIRENEGADAARYVEKLINGVLGGYQKVTNQISLFIAFLDFLSTVNENNYDDLKCDSIVVENTFHAFCVHFFKTSVANKNCLTTAKKRWNDGAPAIAAVFFNTKFFAAPNHDITNIPMQHKTGAESKITIIHNPESDKYIKVKSNLITDVPLHLTDDEAIELILDDIVFEYNICTQWALAQYEDLWRRFRENNYKFNINDFDLGVYEFRAKFSLNSYTRVVQAGKIKKIYKENAKTNLAHDLGMPVSFSLTPFLILLINEHPEITESFLYNFELYDKNGHFFGVFELDNGTYLKGYKFRKNGAKAEQTIKLNDSSKVVIERIISITSKARDYLRNNGIDSYRKLLLDTGQAFHKPKASIPTFKVKSKYVTERLKQLKLLFPNVADKKLSKINNNLRLPKYRATCGAVHYIKHKDARAMSEVLGHDKYKPDLLAHYLPEPILKFFQSRWIRIFQKGIICEAMKNSSNLLIASGFKNINELSIFLRNHSLNYQDNAIHDGKNSTNSSAKHNSDKVFIGVNVEILKVLLAFDRDFHKEKTLLSRRHSDLLELSNLVVKNIESSDDTILQGHLDIARTELQHYNLGDDFYGPA
ncbi:MAG: hypothetical protein ACI9LM_005093 [Alteromonadaceae bacterium]